MDETNFDVDSFCTRHESSHEWELRRAFLLAHHDKFPLNRLLCLSNCFVSVECYGCRYPTEVMKQLEELGAEAKGAIKHHKPLIGQLAGVKFVKSAGDDRKNASSRV